MLNASLLYEGVGVSVGAPDRVLHGEKNGLSLAAVQCWRSREVGSGSPGCSEGRCLGCWVKSGPPLPYVPEITRPSVG